MKIQIKTQPYSEMRYDTVGDYLYNDDEMNVYVADLGNDDMNFLVGIHELIEMYLTKKRGISEESISDFDKQFEENRPEGNTDEPGDDKNSPYKREHFFATTIERLIAAELNVDWKEYDDKVFSIE
jgi:hypothetical protein